MDESDLSKKKDLVKLKIKEYIKEYYKRMQNPEYNNKSINLFKLTNIEDIIKRLRINDEMIVSKSTVQSALNELKNTIIKKNGVYVYTNEAVDANENYPILRFAKDIEIVNLRHRDLCFLRISPNFAVEIANYLNTVIREDLIQSIAIGNMIMCIDVGYSEDNANQHVEKEEGFEDHITRVLAESTFNFVTYSFIDTSGDEVDTEQINNTPIPVETEAISDYEKDMFDKIMMQMDSLVERHVKKYMIEYFKNNTLNT